MEPVTRGRRGGGRRGESPGVRNLARPSKRVRSLRVKRCEPRQRRARRLASPGVLGLSLIARPLHRTFWTLSAWQDQAALRVATGHQPHVQIMKHFRPLMAASSFVTWTATDLPIPWDEARRRLEKPDTVHGRS